jgi:hypothetical protein
VAVNTVNAAFAVPAYPIPGGGSVTVLQSPSGATGDSTFIIDCRALKTKGRGSMRGRTIMLLNNGTQFTTIASVNTSLNGVSYETSKVWFSAVTTPFQEGTQAAVTITTGTITTWVAGHDFNYIKIVTTVGDATSGFTLTIGG